jgi:hypothetical protein
MEAIAMMKPIIVDAACVCAFAPLREKSETD